MYQPGISNQVRLTHDLPEQWLHRGEQGTVKSKWFSPAVAFEVEFQKPGERFGTRVVLSSEQIEPGMSQPGEQRPGEAQRWNHGNVRSLRQ